MSLTEYKIKSQEHMVNHLKTQFDKITKEMNEDPKCFDMTPENIQKFNMWDRLRNILIVEEDKLKRMKEDFKNAN